MHAGAVLVFDAGPLGLRNGGLDIERVRAYTAAQLAASPRARQRRVALALGRLPAWLDDPFFELASHVRHLALPRPGDERQLKRLASALLSEPLDRDKPPWQLVFVEGLDDDRFALIAKADLALGEGDEGFDPLAALLRATPNAAFVPMPRADTQATPGRVALLRAELARRARELARIEAASDALGSGLRAALNALERAITPRADAPLLGPTGPHRRVEWLVLDESDVRSIADRLQSSAHALLLASVAGALRAFLARRGLEADELELRALTPIDAGGESSVFEAPLVALPLAQPDPSARLAALAAAPEPRAPDDEGFALLASLGALHGAAAAARPASLCVMTPSAPPSPRFLLGCALRECVAFAPLLPGHTLGVAITRCAGRTQLGFAADAALVADLPLLADAVAASFDELRRLASGEVHQVRTAADHKAVRNSGAEP